MLRILDYKKWHFVGIGGVSMSKLACYINQLGLQCSGSDSCHSWIVEKLIEQGINAYVGIDGKVAEDSDIVVYNSAIPSEHPERLRAKLAIERKELLAMVERDFVTSICISGAHGKTTVSSMITHLLLQSGHKVLSHVGGEVNGYDAYHQQSGADTIVIEACEYARSFLMLKPSIGIVLNVDFDHPDCYLSLADTYIAFATFLSHTQRVCIVYEPDMDRLIKTAETLELSLPKLISFGESEGDYHLGEVNYSKGCYSFEVIKNDIKIAVFDIHTLNRINVVCALAAVAIADSIGCDVDDVKKGIATFAGVGRRLEYIGDSSKQARVYTDYAHHPREIRALLDSIREVAGDGIAVVFQPHTYSRTLALKEEFVECFQSTKNLFILPTYSARESIAQGMTGEELQLLICNGNSNCKYCSDNYQLAIELNQLDKIDYILLVGAGIDYVAIYELIK